MSNFIGIRHEDRYEMERRAPLTPDHVERLIKTKKLDFIIQSSDKRIFKDHEFEKAGAKISDSLEECSVILGVKEMPEWFFEPQKTYVFFAHIIKGQPYNMPMLRKMMEMECNLIDYEKVVDEQGRRLIFFGRYAGLAGMINSLWALGIKLKEEGISSPFEKIKQAHQYSSLEEARSAVSEAGQHIAEHGLPVQNRPLVFALTGYGNVSQGAQEILSLLPVKEISPAKLLSLRNRDKLPLNIIHKVIFKEEHLVEPIDNSEVFNLHTYYSNPEKFIPVFEKYAPFIDLLVNCVYWDARYPRLLTKDFLQKLYSGKDVKLKVISDISCDVNGSVECTDFATKIEEPLYVYNPLTRQSSIGFKGEGILMMTVDILPAELPRDASNGFADVLINFVKPIADADFNESFEELDLPKAIKRALILHRGKLTPEYTYLEEFINQ